MSRPSMAMAGTDPRPGAASALESLRGRFGGLLGRLTRHPIARGSAIVFLGGAAATAVGLVKSILLARALGAAIFGVMAYALALPGFAAQFIDMRTGDNLIRFVGASIARKENVKAATYFHLGIAIDFVAGLLALAVIGLIVVPLAGRHPEHELLQALILVYMWAIPFRLLRSPFHAVLVVFQRFDVASAIQFAGRILELAAIVILLPLGVVAVVKVIVVVTVLETLAVAAWATFLFHRRTGVWRGAGYRRAWRDLRPFTFYGSAVGSLKSLRLNLDIVVLGALRLPAEVGYYTIARGGADVLALAVGSVSHVVHPLINEAWAVKDRPKVKLLIQRLMAVNGALSAAALLVVLVGARWLVTAFYGPDFGPAAPVFRILVLVVAFQAVTGWMRELILIAGHPRLDLFAGFVGTAAYLVLLVPFVAWRGAQGLAVLLIVEVFVMVGLFGWILWSRVYRGNPTSAADLHAPPGLGRDLPLDRQTPRDGPSFQGAAAEP